MKLDRPLLKSMGSDGWIPCFNLVPSTMEPNNRKQRGSATALSHLSSLGVLRIDLGMCAAASALSLLPASRRHHISEIGRRRLSQTVKGLGGLRMENTL